MKLARFDDTKQRYISSFLLSSLFYFLLLALLYSLHADKEELFKTQKEEFSRISLSTMVYQEPKPLAKQNMQKKPVVQKQTVQKKQVPKPVAKKAVPLPQQSIEKAQEKPIEDVIEKPLADDLQTQQKTQKINELQKAQEEAEALQRLQQKEAEQMLLAKKEKEAKQNLFIEQLRERINKNKSYPMTARRRAIEGSIEMQFYLLRNGQVKDIRYISGKTLFESSAREAIQKSFPMDVDTNLFTFPKEFKIKLLYDII
jgi:periplasmic protein TonB